MRRYDDASWIEQRPTLRSHPRHHNTAKLPWAKIQSWPRLAMNDVKLENVVRA